MNFQSEILNISKSFFLPLYTIYNSDQLRSHYNQIMSFFSKIVENKPIAIAAGIALALGAAFTIYSSYKSEQEGPDSKPEIKQELNLKKEIQGLKAQINLSNPSLDDVKHILEFSMTYSKKKILQYSRQFKKRRRQFTNDTRKTNMKQYLNVVSNGMQEVRNLATNTQAEIMGQLGLNQSIFIKYQAQLGLFMQQMMMKQNQNPTQKQLTLEEVKYSIRLQTEYLKKQGQKLLDLILQSAKNWTPNMKAQLPILLSVIITDGAFEDHPQIDQQALQAAEMQLQHHLVKQMTELQEVMNPLMAKLSREIGGMGMGGLGQMGGLGFEDFGGAGEGFGGMNGISAEQMQQLQELERLRVEDPAAFEQVMRNMMGMGY